jgi:hypothetical protein
MHAHRLTSDSCLSPSAVSSAEHVTDDRSRLLAPVPCTQMHQPRWSPIVRGTPGGPHMEALSLAAFRVSSRRTVSPAKISAMGTLSHTLAMVGQASTVDGR